MKIWIAILMAWLTIPGTADELRFNRDIRPILSEKCYRCHGPDARQRQADLRLDSRLAAIESGAISPENLAGSALLERIESTDPEVRMPPPDSQLTLNADELATLRKWVIQGAEYEEHWAYVPPRRTPLPVVEGGSASPIDAFVNDALRRKSLAASPPAERATLLRRVYLDLIGLPPPVEVQAAWREHHQDDDYERLVDALLASPHFGERMAAAWLDVVRYADTVGYHGDQNQNVFPYRDWVIEAFNRNLPFDTFTEWQIAGDLIDQPTDESRVASCFNRLNMMTREGGAQPKEYLAKYAADRVRTVAGAWLGSTMGCAECHDHKYDPFTMRDFYSLAAFFADLRQWGVYQDYEYTPNPDLRGWSNDHPFPPEISVPIPYLESRAKKLSRARDELASKLWWADIADSKATKLRLEWIDQLKEFFKAHPEGWQSTNVGLHEPTNDLRLADSNDSSISLIGSSIDAVTLEIESLPISTQAIRLDLLAGKPDGKLVGSDSSPAFNLAFSFEKIGADGQKGPLRVHFADAKLKQIVYFNNAENLGMGNVWRVPADCPAGSAAVWIFDQPISLGPGEKLRISMKGNQARNLRWSASPCAPLDCRSPNEFGFAMASIDFENPSPLLARQWLLAKGGQTREAIRSLESQIRDCRGGRAWVQVSISTTPIVTRVLPRGNWQDESGDVVQPAVPNFLTAVGAPPPSSPSRLDLARWLVAPNNPLTARVQVNRLWRHLFGSGLTPILDDFGLQGQYPTHPELLDWLAVEFRESGWNYKHMVKLIVMSNAYRRSTESSPESRAVDPRNLWLSHQNARRLEAEIVRDNALAASGLLVQDIGGPPVYPYQPPGYYAQLQFPDRDYPEQKDDRRYRRGIYAHWQRTFLHPMMANFDAPPREECTGQRTEANTPLQALTLMNDPTFMEAATALAAHLVAAQRNDAHRIQELFVRALCREPNAEEIQSVLAFLNQQREEFASRPEAASKVPQGGTVTVPKELQADPIELASWISVCRAVLNLHETITRY